MRTPTNSVLRGALIVLSFFFSFCQILNAFDDFQNNKIDSLEQLIAVETVDTIKYKLLGQLVGEHTAIDRLAAIPILEEQLELAEKIGDPNRIAKTAHLIGSQYLYLGKTDSAYVYEMLAKALIEDVDDPFLVADNLNSLALIYQRENKYEQAIESYQEVIVYSDSIGDYVGSVYTYINLMSLFMDLDDEVSALKYLDDIERVQDMFPELPKRDVDEIKGLFSAIYLNVGLCHTHLNQLDTADYYYNKAYECLEYIRNEYAKTYYKGYIDNSLGDNYFTRFVNVGAGNADNNYLNQALSFYQNANSSFVGINEERGVSFTLNNLGKTLDMLGKPQEAREKLVEALKLSQKLDYVEEIRDAYENLAHNSENLGDYSGAINYFKQHVVYKDSIRNEERDKTTRGLEVKFETAQKEREVIELALENEKKTREQAIQQFIFIISVLILLGLAYAIYTRMRYKKQKELANYEREMNQAMSRFVPMGFIKALGKDKITDVKLGDQIETNVTVVFTDIRSFTTISEGMTPNENFAFVKEYAERMGPIIEDHGGFISQYLGDGIMAIFKNSATDALDACIKMQRDIKEYNRLLQERNTKPITVGMGLHSGPLVMGIIGDERRWDATLISDTVNTAARIESSTKQFSSPILLSEDSVKQLAKKETYNLTPMGELTVKGKTKPVAVFECDVI